VNIRSSFRIAGALALLLSGPAAHAANLIRNGNFQTPQPGVTPPSIVSYTSPPGGADVSPASAAADWQMWINDTGGNSITTQLVPSTFPGAPKGTLMMHVTVTTYNSGLWAWLPRTASGTVYVCAWIYLNHGAVGIGAGDDAYSEQNMTLDRQGSWEVLEVSNQGTGPQNLTNLALIYAEPSVWDPAGTTDFDVQNVTVTTSHAQCKPY
jgi:hypothetical protein